MAAQQSKLRRFLRALMRWFLLPLLAIVLLLAGFRLFFPQTAQSLAAACARQLLLRALAWQAGTGWAGGGFEVQRNLWVPMRDGIRLSTDLYLPTSTGPHPTVVLRTPYSKEEGALIGEFFARYGYAVVVQDTRGRHRSEGGFYPFRAEMQDGYDTTAWLRRQPWCNGKIGGFGSSYLGLTQWALAVNNPNITSVAPTFIGGRLHDVIYSGGAFSELTYLHWSLSSAGRYGDLHAVNHIRKGFEHLPLVDADDAAHADIGFFNDWVQHPEPDEYWDSLSPLARVEDLSAPAFLTAGWYDFMHKGQLADFERIRANAPPAVRAATKILIGPWSHSFFNYNLKNYGVAQGRFEAIPFEYVKASKDWLDYTLKGIDNGWSRRAPVRAYLLGANEWRDLQDWPPRDAAPHWLYLRSGGALTEREPNSAEQEDTFVFDPANPVPTAGGAHGDAWTAGPIDQREVEKRTDVLVYSTPPLPRSLTVIGRVQVKLFAASSAPDTDFTAKLVDVFPDGKALIVCEGILRARYREGFNRPKLLTPGQVYPLDIDIGPTAVAFQPGHRVRLEISSSNAPRYDVNPNTGAPIATERQRQAATQRILHSADHSSALILPIVSR